MTDKEFGKQVKEINATLKRVTADASTSANAIEFCKFLQKTHAKALTFDKEHTTYKNYLADAMKPKKAKDAEVARDKKAAAAKEKKEAGDNKKKTKADGPTDDEKEKPAKKAKSS